MTKPPCNRLALLRTWQTLSATTNPALRSAIEQMEPWLSAYRTVVDDRVSFSMLWAISAAGLDDMVPAATRR
jgi:K+-transporting ATPase c subunit